MDFSIALGHLKAGRRVSREGWNGKGMYILRVGPQDWNADNDTFDEREAMIWALVRAAGGRVSVSEDYIHDSPPKEFEVLGDHKNEH